MTPILFRQYEHFAISDSDVNVPHVNAKLLADLVWTLKLCVIEATEYSVGHCPTTSLTRKRRHSKTGQNGPKRADGD